MSHIIAINSKVSIEYIINDDIKKLITIGIAGVRGITSASSDCFTTPSFEIDFSKYTGQL